MTFDRPITVQRMGDDERWEDLFSAHARVNKATGRQSVEAGAMRSYQTLSFRIRWRPECREVAASMQRHRVVYEGRTYAVEDTDDYMQRHRTFEMEGASYG